MERTSDVETVEVKEVITHVSEKEVSTDAIIAESEAAMNLMGEARDHMGEARGHFREQENLLLTRLETLTAQEKALQAEINRLQGQREQLQSVVQTEKVGITAQIDQIRAELAEETTAAEAIKAKLHGDVAEIQAKRSTLEDQIARLQAQEAELQNVVANKETEITFEVSELAGSVRKHWLGELNARRDDLGVAKTQVEALDKQLLNTEEQFRKSLDFMKVQSQARRGDLGGVKAGIEVLENQLRGAKTQIDEIENQLLTLEKQFETSTNVLISDSQTRRAELERVKSGIEELADKLFKTEARFEEKLKVGKPSVTPVEHVTTVVQAQQAEVPAHEAEDHTGGSFFTAVRDSVLPTFLGGRRPSVPQTPMQEPVQYQEEMAHTSVVGPRSSANSATIQEFSKEVVKESIVRMSPR